MQKLVDAGILQQMQQTTYGKEFVAGEILRATSEDMEQVARIILFAPKV